MADDRDWPGECPKDIIYGNFRPTAYERATRPRRERARDRRAGMSKTHLARIRKCLCANPECYRRTGIHAHHLQSGPARPFRGAGLKAVDRLAVPLCWECHADLHRYGSRREFGWFDTRGLNPYLLANALWNKSRDRDEENSIEDMAAIVEMHKRNALATLLARAEALPRPEVLH